MGERPPPLERPDENIYGGGYSDAYMREVIGLAELYGAVFSWEPDRTLFGREDPQGWYWYVNGVRSGNKHKTYTAQLYLLELNILTVEELDLLRERLSAGPTAPQPTGG